ncbi:LOW QUALITY PROTEIN: pre-mRNA-splicing factor 38A-like [Talpa occidentalis]|uniref:LOW QUALITY PROTEIN: pre-mRNA-splicing factor 38A-like n=1 Tax=Talpa occidentalis TaxID=50954 RepID=UPI00188E73A7|nr:LOW QUALITY PROTEIN: pre-mRNA-splicing factor 38A-like [Talpa occidentalis]
MANCTVKDAHSIHGTNPQYLVEKIIRARIYESKYWKEECFGLTAELAVDKAMELRFVGGVYGGNIKPTPFLCLTLKMLQIQPEKDIIVQFIKNEDFKYVRMVGALYMRLTGTATDCYKYLEPLYNDYRKIKIQKPNGEFELMHVDEFIDELLHSERVCDIVLPRLQKRDVLEEAEQWEPSPDHCRRSHRDVDKPWRSPTLRYRRSRSQSPRRQSRSPKRRRPSPRQERHQSRSPRGHRSWSRDRRHRSRSKSPGHHRSHRCRSHSKSPVRSKKSHKKSQRRNE